MYSQLDLWNKLNEENTLQEVQQYIKDVIEIRGFSNQEIEKTMLLLLEEVGELAKAIRKNSTDMGIDKKDLPKLIDKLEKDMHKAAKILDFERAAEIRDKLKKMREMLNN